MLNITTEVVGSKEKKTGLPEKEDGSLKRYLLEKIRTWINGLLEAERDELLGRGRYQALDQEHDNYRNG